MPPVLSASKGHCAVAAEPAPAGAPAMGARLQRREDFALVTGRGRFVDDIRLADALHVAFVRSTAAHGRIKAIDASEARAGPGVAAIYTGADVADLGDLTVNQVVDGMKIPPFPVLAGMQVRAVGQPVAAVLAMTANLAADAADAVLVEIDAQPALATLADAARGDALFEAVPGNIVLHKTWRAGRVDEIFAGAAHVVRAEAKHPRLAPTSLEPRGIAADYDAATGGLTVWLTTQTPHRSRTDLARILGLDSALIRLIAPDVGGAFGMKASLYPEEVLVAWAAWTLKRPVRWTASRSEDLLSASHGRGGWNCGSLAVSEDGRFLALRAEMIAPLGHWLTNSAAIPAWNAGRILPGPYAVEAVDISARALLTHTAPVGIYRGAGRPEAALLMERLVEEAARATGLDPAEIRRRNLIGSECMPHAGPTGIVLDSGNYPQALETFCRFAGYEDLKNERDARRAAGETTGIGLAFYVEPCGRGWESARVELCADGRIVGYTGSSSQGHGRETAYAQIVADVFGVDPDKVEIRAGDTATCPNGIGAVASRSTAIGGSALLAAAREAKAKADRDGGPAVAETVYETGGEAWGYGCHLAVVSIDVETGVLTVERIFCLDDVGTVINPMLVEGQIMGGVAQGFGEAMLEEIVYDADGQLLTGSLSDYALPRADRVPEIRIAAMATPSPLNLLGAKGVGEAGAIGAPAAILNAALDALTPHGVRDLTMPLTGGKIWSAIAAARKAGNDEV